MEQHFLSFRRPYTIWTTPIPCNNSTLDSPPLFLNGCHWFFTFKVLRETGIDPMWWFHFRRIHREEALDMKFLVAILAKNKEGGFETIDCGVVYDDRTYRSSICGASLSIYEANHPNVDFSGATMTFLFIFEHGIRDTTNYQDIERDHKSVQTSPCSVLHPCLESLSQDFRKLLGDDSNSDIHVICGNRTFSIHKHFLEARSEVFRAMLRSDMLERQQGSVKISDIEPDVFELFLQYLYSGTLPELTVDTASPLYEASDKYRVDGLKWRCGNFLAENLMPGNACGILAMADAHSDKDLKERIISYVLDENIPDREDDWSRFSDDHPRLSSEVLYRAYKRRNVSCRCK